jgi:hypothetical protein
MNEIKNDEFQRWMNQLARQIDGVNDRLDELNGRTRASEQKIAVLEDRSAGGKSAAWGGGVAGVLISIVEIIKWVSGRP